MRQILLIAATAALFSMGCRNGGGLWWPAGSMDQQQQRAVIHDPYPLNDVAPEAVGGRPREFQQGLPEAVRNQIRPQGTVGGPPPR